MDLPNNSPPENLVPPKPPESAAAPSGGSLSAAPHQPIPKRRGRPPGSKNKTPGAVGPAPIVGPANPGAPTLAPANTGPRWPEPAPETVKGVSQQMLFLLQGIGRYGGHHWYTLPNPEHPFDYDKRLPMPPEFLEPPAKAMCQLFGEELNDPRFVLIAFGLTFALPNAILTFQMYKAKKEAENAKKDNEPVKGEKK